MEVSSNTKLNLSNIVKILSKILLIIGCVTTIMFTWIFLTKQFIDQECDIDPSIWGQYGDIMGGVIGTIFSLVGVLLLVETLKGGEKNQIENRIFELIKFHKENINEISSDYEGGRMLFKNIVEEIDKLQKKVCECECILIKENLIEKKFEELDKLNVAYLIAFFGLDIENNEELKNKVCSFTDCDILMKKALECIPKMKSEFEQKNPNYNIHIGYQFILGHYFRHMFQTVRYINEKKGLSFKEKYFYVKTLRAQLSTYEQILFYYNSVSTLGRIWELDIYDKKYSEDEFRVYTLLTKIPFIGKYIMRSLDYPNYNRKLITKYNLIKNIPTGLCPIEPSIFYSNVIFEGQTKTEEKETIEMHYS